MSDRTFYLITVKLPKNPSHDPRNKVTGPCPVNFEEWCTDVTGEHHTVVIRSDLDLDAVTAWARKKFSHVTRIETNCTRFVDPQEADPS